MPHHRTERGPCNRMDRNIPSGTMGKGVTTMELDSWFVSDDPVAAVDPADLRSVWTMGRTVQATAPGQQTAISTGCFERACSPGADTQAVWYRVAMLQMLAGPLGLLSPWLRDGELADVVFQVAATFPMKRPAAGGPPQRLSPDVYGILPPIQKDKHHQSLLRRRPVRKSQ